MAPLNIIVCVKQVVDPEMPASAFKIDSDTMRVVESQSTPPVLNGFDENAVEAALRIKDAVGAHVTALSMGATFAMDVVKKPLSMGADELVLLHDDAFDGLDSFATAMVLSEGIEKIGEYDLILAGRQASDWDNAHVPFGIAESLDLPCLTVAQKVEVDGGRRKSDPGLEAHLGNGIRLHEPGAFEGALRRLEGRVAADPDSASEWVFRALEAGGAQVVERADPCQLAKAAKNEAELAGARAAHLRDGAALARFLCWLDRAAPSGTLTEIAAADCLEARRRENAHFRGLSFPTISGAGPNGAIVHYRASGKTNRRLEPGSLYLVDSGAQYLDGTTDVTRTVAIGAPDAEMRDRFTRVLKGHIAIAAARFPEGTQGGRLDTLARAALWDAGLDYAHGTGHGVGSYLGVHEGPQRISGAAGGAPLRPGMIVSNEPGYYKAGAWGIRIENLVAVTTSGEGEDGRAFLGFETLTLAPIDRRLVEPALLRADERAWLDAYHARVRAALAPRVDANTAAWLEAACAPLGSPARRGGGARG